MDIFTLFGTIAINNSGANKSIDSTSRKATGLQQNMSKAFTKISKDALACGRAVAKGLAVVSAAGAAAAGYLLKESIGNYAEYEQLVGGVETLFKDSSDAVFKYARNAYKTAGLSANDYMSTVTSFSASLLQGLGGDTAAAAEMSNLAITDMSDNANKMGTSMASIQDAYQGFAKQNYTMLDNLKLGYGGTASEMARLINDSGVMGDTMEVTAETLNQVSFAKIIEAIHVIQTEMGITGTTAKESTETITGSFNAWKASWTNLMAGMADDENIDPLVDAFFETGQTMLKNIVRVLPSIGKNIQRTMSLAGQEVKRIWSQNIWPNIQQFSKATFGIELPEWSTIESAISSWWNENRGTVDEILNIGENALSNTLDFAQDAYQWYIDNDEAVNTALGVIAGGLTLCLAAANPLATALALIVTNWREVKDLYDDTKQLFGISVDKEFDEAAKAAGYTGSSGDLYDERGIKNPLVKDPRVKNISQEKLGILLAAGEIDVSQYEKNLGNNAVPVNARLADDAEDEMQKELDGMSLKADVQFVPITNQLIAAVNSITRGVTMGVNAVIGSMERSTIKSATDLMPDGSHAGGLDYVPRDNYLANLHMGEAVLTRAEADVWRSGGFAGNNANAMLSRMETTISNMVNVLQTIAQNTGAEKYVALDSGALVGQLAPRIDAHMGTLTARKERRG